MTTKSAIIALSGGLDSLVSLSSVVDKVNVILALTFDYSQRAAEDEIEAARKICDFYKIEHRVIKLPFLAEITNTALTNKNQNLEFEKLDENSAKNVWVPNRNGLFLNIMASFADSYGANYLIIGANKEEAGTFPDNGEEFVEKANEFFEYSTMKKPKILAPLKKMEKYEIVNLGLSKGAPFEFLKSCYNSTKENNGKHCGKCESCKRLAAAIKKSNKKDLINLFF